MSEQRKGPTLKKMGIKQIAFTDCGSILNKFLLSPELRLGADCSLLESGIQVPSGTSFSFHTMRDSFWKK